MRIKDTDVPKTAFATRYGLFEWRVVPFGLTNAPSVFMRVMNHLFADLLDQGVVVFLDDILIYSENVTDHFRLLATVFDRLRKYEFFCKLKKCSFLKQKTSFLGFDFTNQGVRVQDAKVAAVSSWPTPTTTK